MNIIDDHVRDRWTLKNQSVRAYQFIDFDELLT